jgi:hypothetical protein
LAAAREQGKLSIANYQLPIVNWLFVLSGVAGGLAVLTKSPLVVLLPVVASVWGWNTWQKRRAGRPHWWRSSLIEGVGWVAGFVLTWLLLFPALWSAPLSVWQMISGSAGRHLEEALRPTFFMGRVAFDHGPLFYPVALLWRLSPAVVIGLILLLWAMVRRIGRQANSSIVVLLSWVFLFLGAITPAAKKFDRYALPAIPALILLAALGWVWAARPKQNRHAAERDKTPPTLVFRHSWRWLLGLAVVGQVGYWLLFWPYPLAAYNWLVGGPLTATRVMAIGWGEGISAGGRWLDDFQPQTSQATAVAGIAPSLAPFFSGETLLAERGGREQADYLIYTIESQQERPAELAAETAGLELLHTIRYGGLAQAWVYRQPTPQSPQPRAAPLAEPVSFGGRVLLQATGHFVTAEQVVVLARWQQLATSGHLLVKLSLRDEQGNTWSGLESDLLNEVYFYPESWVEGETPEVAYWLERPLAMPPGDYMLSLSLFDVDSGAQLAAVNQEGAFQGVEYALGMVTIPPPEAPVAVERLQIPPWAGATWFEGALLLLGHSAVQPTVVNGGELPLDLYWQSAARLPEGVEVEWRLEREGAEQPLSWTHTTALSRYDTGRWRLGEVVQEKVRLRVPAELAAGNYLLRVVPVGGGQAWTIGRVEVIATDRLFQLPEGIEFPLAHRFGEGIYLRGMEFAGVDERATVVAGSEARLTLYWQPEIQPAVIYTALVHVLDEEGGIVAQADHWPGGIPSHTWAAGQVIVDQVTLAVGAEVPPGDYRVAVGLYTAEDGVRLPVDGGAADQVVLTQRLHVAAADE